MHWALSLSAEMRVGCTGRQGEGCHVLFLPAKQTPPSHYEERPSVDKEPGPHSVGMALHS